MFAEALKMVSGTFDALFYVPTHVDAGREDAYRLEQILQERWQTAVGVTLAQRSPPVEPKGIWSRYFKPALGFHHVPDYLETSGEEQVKAFDSCLRKNPSFIFAQRLRCMPPLLLSHEKLPPVFFDTADIEHIAFKRSIAMPPQWRSKWLLNLQVPAILAGEKRSIALSKKTFVCSSIEKSLLGEFADIEKVEVVPNAVRIPEKRPLTSDRRLMILGQYGYAPNRIGAEYFIDKVWHLVLSQLPDARLIVAGPAPEKISQFASPPPGVEFTGFVDDLEELYGSIRVVVCPILSGAGTRVKLVEAAAFGKPIVSTRIGAEGLDFEDGVHALLRDDPAEMAEGCIALLKDDGLSHRLAEAARRLARENYESGSVARKIADIFSAV